MTTPTPTPGHTNRIDRADAEATLYRVAICAFTYYPDKPVREPGYTIDEDVAWCLAPLTGLDTTSLSRMRGAVRDAITDPTAHRRSLLDELATLTDK